MTTRYYCAIFPFCGGGKKKTTFYDWATTGISVISFTIVYRRPSKIERANTEKGQNHVLTSRFFLHLIILSKRD